MSDLKDRVLGIFDYSRDETVELPRELIRTPNTTGEEKQIAKLITRKLI